MSNADDETVLIEVKKSDIRLISDSVDIIRIIDNDSLEYNINHIKKDIDRSWLKEFKINIGFGASYGIINKEFDIGPSINIGWEFTF